MKRNRGRHSRDVKILIRDIYNELAKSGGITLSVDFVPYTEDFEKVYIRVPVVYHLTRHDVWCVLINERKQGKCAAPSNGKQES